MDKLLTILCLVVTQPGRIGQNLLPEILTLSLDLVSPVLNEHKQSAEFSDVTLSLFALFDG